MLRVFIVAAFALASIPALAQQQGGGGGGGGSVTGCETSGTGIQKGNGSGGCAAAATSDLHALSAQLTSAATNGDGNYTIAAATFRAATSAALTAPRVWTLPAAASVNAGDVIVVSDDAGGVSATNTLTISRAPTGGTQDFPGAWGKNEEDVDGLGNHSVVSGGESPFGTPGVHGTSSGNAVACSGYGAGPSGATSGSGAGAAGCQGVIHVVLGGQ